MGHLNFNSLRNIFESIKMIISPFCDIFLVLETKTYEFWNSIHIINVKVIIKLKNSLMVYHPYNAT